MIREIAFDVLRKVQEEDAYANLILPKLLRDAKVDSRDAGFVQELSFGAIRLKLLHERVIELASKRKIEEIEPNAVLVLRLGCYQLLQMRVPVHAAINESVNLAKSKCSKGAVGFVNAVLRNIAAKEPRQWLNLLLEGNLDLDAKLSLSYSHPIWIIKSLRQALDSRSLGHTLEDLLAANNEPAKVSIVALPGLASPSDFLDRGTLGGASPLGVEIDGNPASLQELSLGKARVQDQGSQLAVLALTEAKVQCEDAEWLDLCAGPGGKAALMGAIALQRGVKLTANEILPHRADLVRKAVIALPNVEVTVADGRQLAANKKYSRILLDAPCTGLGALRRRPEARWRKSTADLTELSQLQRQLFDSAWEALLPGGVLAYVTCSPHLSETTAQVSWAQAKYKNEISLVAGNEILNGINPALGLNEKLSTIQLWPHIHGTDAMFIALFRKSLS